MAVLMWWLFLQLLLSSACAPLSTSPVLVASLQLLTHVCKVTTQKRETNRAGSQQTLPITNARVHAIGDLSRFVAVAAAAPISTPSHQHNSCCVIPSIQLQSAPYEACCNEAVAPVPTAAFSSRSSINSSSGWRRSPPSQNGSQAVCQEARFPAGRCPQHACDAEEPPIGASCSCSRCVRCCVVCGAGRESLRSTSLSRHAWGVCAGCIQ